MNDFVQLGVEAAFKKGEFDGILPDGNLKLGEIKHRVTIEVTEDGTVGAAASSIEVVAFSGFFEVPTEIVIDKSFIFYIYDTLQQVTLFAGKFTNPEKQ